MKVPFSKTVEVDGEVDITADDIVKALDEISAEAASISLEQGASKTKRSYHVRYFIGNVINCLHAVSNGMIASLSDEHAKLIADALWEQAKRYARASK